MVTRPLILLDDGGVMNDNRLRGEQWPPLIGEFFAPRLGGTKETWAAANRTIIQDILDPTNWLSRMQTFTDYANFEHVYWLDWLGGMCQLVGITLPSIEESITLARQAESYVISRVRSAFPGASEAIRQLDKEGYVLHTASSESSVHLTLYLEGMGVRDCFGQFYGADLLNTMKEGTEYYSRLFGDLQIAPVDALVVDDSPRALAFARELGACTVLVSKTYEGNSDMLCIGSLAELPALLKKEEKRYLL
ncbi:MAG: HAD family hydrolase [Ktedonobacteraceae bacterium]|nr:HAD family hydrolase [Ktedonobacteraceae bacterium]